MAEVDDIAGAIERANGVILEAVRTLGHTPGWLRPIGGGDMRTAAALAYHIAIGYEAALAWATSIRDTGEMPEITEATIHAQNAEHAVEFSAVAPEDVEHLLRADCALLTSFVSSLVDTDLGRSSRNEALTRVWSIRDVLETTVRHTSRHTAQFLQAASQ
jgi:DinB superfamily